MYKKIRRRENTNQMADNLMEKKILSVFYGSIGLTFAVKLYYTCLQFPLFPFQSDSAEWSFAWLMTTVYDFYTLSACLCLVILSSEEKLWVGVCWVLLINFLGSPFACLWVIINLQKRKRLALCTDTSASPAAANSSTMKSYSSNSMGWE